MLDRRSIVDSVSARMLKLSYINLRYDKRYLKSGVDGGIEEVELFGPGRFRLGRTPSQSFGI